MDNDTVAGDDTEGKSKAPNVNPTGPKLRYGKGLLQKEPQGGFVPCCDPPGGGGAAAGTPFAAATGSGAIGHSKQGTPVLTQGGGADGALGGSGMEGLGGLSASHGSHTGTSGGGDKSQKNVPEKNSRVASLFGAVPWKEMASEILYAKVSEMVYNPLENAVDDEKPLDPGGLGGPPHHPHWAHLWKPQTTESTRVLEVPSQHPQP